MFSHLVSEGDGFTVWFIHSVNQSPVAEIFEIRNEEIVLSALEFEDFGAGMPTEIQPGQALTHLPCGTMRIDGGFDTGEIRYMVGRATDFVLYVGTERVMLNELADPGTLVEFSIRRGCL
ncbi:MAG: DUF1850 domain-containing protein [Defluviitaleaceae bacterium]|nr:DUF1850 domain-containing protein [Defluviitaleaceae bacterium]